MLYDCMYVCIYVCMYLCSQHHTIPALPTVFDQEEVGHLPHREKQQDKKVYVVEVIILLTQMSNAVARSGCP